MRIVVTLSICLACACGGPERRAPASAADLRSITETEGITLIREVMAENGVAAELGWEVNVGATEPFAVDVRLAQTAFGVEFVSGQDRADHGDRIPHPDPSGQLRIMPGAGDDAQVQILVVDHRTYRYDPDRERVQRGSVGAAEAQDRLRRDLRDYIQYVRDQGAL